MKKVKLLLIGLFATVLLPSAAQQPAKLPADNAIRQGKLPNGLTYYIRHNAEPKGQVNFYIAQKVGSIQENDDQRGLAHFLEHMAFNGSKHFPNDGQLIKYCESIGVKFGENLNATPRPTKRSTTSTMFPWRATTSILVSSFWQTGRADCSSKKKRSTKNAV